MRQVLPVECRSFACPLQDFHREPPGRFGDPRTPGQRRRGKPRGSLGLLPRRGDFRGHDRARLRGACDPAAPAARGPRAQAALGRVLGAADDHLDHHGPSADVPAHSAVAVLPAVRSGRRGRGAGAHRDHPRLQRGCDGGELDRLGCRGELSERAPRDHRDRRRQQGRHLALHRARRAIVVTVDSDSMIERQTLLAVAGPFRDPRVGAVAGKVAVHNRRANLIPRMLHVRFILSFDFLRSAQSVFRTVYCCPGALAAYRACVVRQVLCEWERQTFLGTPCTYGEDRALTNLILRAGCDTVYQRTAVVHTVVPETYAKLCGMFLRWDRSYIREELRFARIVWKRPLVSRVLALYESTITNLRFPVAYSAIALWAVNALHDPASIVRMLLAIMVVSTLYTLYYLRSERSWDFVFGILYGYFSFFALTWIFPYAALTLRARGWLTR